MNYKLLFQPLVILLLYGCKHTPDGYELEAQFLEQRNLVSDYTIQKDLDSLLDGVNCLAKTVTDKYYVLPEHYNANDVNQILIIPFRRKTKENISSGFSDLLNRCVYISPLQIKAFVYGNSLGDSTDIKGYLSLILLHEMGHFIYKLPGNFDADISSNKQSGLGEQDFGLSPELMTYNKKKELQVDSLAVGMIKQGAKIQKGNCFSVSFNAQMTIMGAEFMIFGKRIIGDFGSPQINFLRDYNLTHPNMELRLAFMNYYINPTDEKRQQIDEYLYNREVKPVHDQELDPRIYQGNEKILGGN